MPKFVSAAIVLSLGVFCWCASGQDTAPPKELVQYVRDAKKAGMNDGQIQQAAAKAGWPAGSVDLAIASIRTEPKPEIAGPKTDGDAKTQEKAASAGDSAAKPADTATPPASATQTSAPTITPGQGSVGAGTPPGTVAPADPAKPDGATPGVKPETVDRRVADDYKVGEGDVLQISVWSERDASVPSVVVRPDGKISMPLLKDVSVEGLTPMQLEKKLTDQFIATNLLKAPDVTVVVMQINSKKIYITGAVKKEGPISFNYRMTVLQALSEAGGLTDYAKRKKIYVLHNENGRQYKYDFDYDAVLKGQHMELNILLEAGDTIVVPH